MTCTERYYPRWLSRGIRAVDCTRPAKLMAMVNPFYDPHWEPKCGIHAKLYARTKPL